MPELPEVEVVCKYLKSNIVNERIISINVFAHKLLKNCNVEYLNEQLQDQTITNVRRRGKYILIDLERNTLVSHLRMEGKWFIVDKEYNKQKHDHILINFKNSQLIYNDSRMFGTIELVSLKEENSLKGIKKIGYEFDDNKLTSEFMLEKLKNKKQAIKTVLLSQDIFTGLGNIYVDEVLFKSQILPTTPSKELTKEQLSNIIIWSQKIMKKSIEYGGSTIKSYSSGRDREGSYQQFIEVYGRNNQNCSVCGNIIEKIKLNGRGTHFCPVCQK